jgi:hypothetical protein
MTDLAETGKPAKFVPGQPDMWAFVLFETLVFTAYFGTAPEAPSCSCMPKASWISESGFQHPCLAAEFLVGGAMCPVSPGRCLPTGAERRVPDRILRPGVHEKVSGRGYVVGVLASRTTLDSIGEVDQPPYHKQQMRSECFVIEVGD